MSSREPGWVPQRLVATAAQALPPAHRGRYRQEFTAELHGMPRSRQLRHSAQVLSRAWALRGALDKKTTAPIGEEAMTQLRTIPLRCRLNLWHTWRRFSTEDGARYSACAKCRKEKPDRYANNTIGG
jgi:hypothetical protein